MHSPYRWQTLVILMPLVFAICVGAAIAQPPVDPHRPGELGPLLDNVTVAPPRPMMETPTVVTFYENEDLTGASYSVEVKPTSSFEATRIVSADEIKTAGLFGKISSVRLVCGTRSSRVSLFDLDLGEFSDGTARECDVNQTVSINLKTETGPLSVSGIRDLNDKLGAAVIVAHVRSSDGRLHYQNFSFVFGQVWKTELGSMDGATNQGTRIWLEDFHTVVIYQSLMLDHWACTARDATFELRIFMKTVNFRPVFQVYLGPEWVAYGFGDGWPTRCRKNMQKDLHSGIKNAASKIESQLPEKLFQETSSPTYYFAPVGKSSDFEVFYWQ